MKPQRLVMRAFGPYAGEQALDFTRLDAEALDKALETLMRLGEGGRLVGIISHVPELRSRIDARLEVTPSASGKGSTAHLRL